MTGASSGRLDSIFRPGSVGVMGVSTDAEKLGNRVLRNIRDGGFQGEIVAIGRAESADGLSVLSSLDAMEKTPDLLFLAVPAMATPDIVCRAGAMGTKAVIVGASGFAEDGDEGADLQARLGAAATQAGVRIIGPNCNGIYSGHSALSIGFNTGHGRRHRLGDVAILSHSGALFDALARRLEGFGAGLSIFASVGNELDLSVLDYLDHALDDPDTQVIALLLDSLPDGRRLRQQSRRAAELGKSIVALKIGESERGAAAAIAHSSRMAGDAAKYAALFRAAGISTASSLEGLMAAAAFLSLHGRGHGGLAGLSTSGAGASIIADIATRHGVAIADFGAVTHARLSARRRFSHLANPVDIGVFGTLAGIDEVVTTMVDDPAVGAFLCMLHSIGPGHATIAKACATSIVATGKPHIVLASGGLPDNEIAAYRASGATLFFESGPCFDALAAFLMPPADGDRVPVEMDTKILPESVEPGPMSEADSLALLSRAGIVTVPTETCRDVEAAVAAAARLGWPVVMKGAIDGIVHKSDMDLVTLNLADEDALRAAFARLKVARVVVQPMVRGDLEVILGFANSLATGPMLLAGLGGIYAEAIGGAALWSLPTTREAISKGIDEHVIGRILASPRWRHPEAREQLIEMLMALQGFAIGNADRVTAIDLNPVILGKGGAMAVDGLIIGVDHTAQSASSS